MKKINIIVCSVLLLAGCTKHLTDLNNDPKHPPVVPSYSLFTRAELSFSNVMSNTNVNSNIFRLIEQQWQEVTYTDESNYDLGTRTIPDNWWNELYAANTDFSGYTITGVLSGFNQARIAARTDVADAGALKNDTAMIDILEVYAYYVLTTTFGNIPYSESLDPDNPFPKYDDAATIINDLISRLDADMAALDEGAGSFGNADIIYSGDISKWKKFANSLKLKIGILLSDSDPAKAKSTVEAAAAADLISSNDDNALFPYQSSTPNTNPVWVDIVQSGRKDFVANNTILGYMKPNNDPRLPYYFTVDANGGYSGGDPGAGSSFPLLSKPGGLLFELTGDKTDVGQVAYPTFPGDLLDYAEVEFYLAEAAARGFSVPGTVEEHYNNAITASIKFWGGSDLDAATYLALPSVNYATAAGTWQQKIGIQAWLAFYNRGFDAWTEQRRLDYPVLPAPENALSDFPVRYTYPTKEENINEPNYKAASDAIGGDDVATKLFFDKF